MGNVLAATGGELIAPESVSNFAMFVSRTAEAEPVASSAAERVAAQPSPQAVDDVTPKKKICCACPETKKARDECIVLNGEEACKMLIDAHKDCLRNEGFNVK